MTTRMARLLDDIADQLERNAADMETMKAFEAWAEEEIRRDRDAAMRRDRAAVEAWLALDQ